MKRSKRRICKLQTTAEQMIFGLTDHTKALRISLNENEIPLMVIRQVLEDIWSLCLKPMDHAFFTTMTKWWISAA